MSFNCTPYSESGIKDVIVSGLNSAMAYKLPRQINDMVRKVVKWCVGEKFEYQPVMLRFVDELKKRYARRWRESCDYC